jgi:hypothetical protein
MFQVSENSLDPGGQGLAAILCGCTWGQSHPSTFHMCFHLSENIYFIYSIIFPVSAVYLIGTDEYISIAPRDRVSLQTKGKVNE